MRYEFWDSSALARDPNEGNPPTPSPVKTASRSVHDAAEVQAGPNVQADGQAGSNGHLDGLAMSGADVVKPEADPFDVTSLRLSQDFASAVGDKKLVTTIPVKKPSKEWFVRTLSMPGLSAPNASLSRSRI